QQQRPTWTTMEYFLQESEASLRQEEDQLKAQLQRRWAALRGLAQAAVPGRCAAELEAAAANFGCSSSPVVRLRLQEMWQQEEAVRAAEKEELAQQRRSAKARLAFDMKPPVQVLVLEEALRRAKLCEIEEAFIQAAELVLSQARLAVEKTKARVAVELEQTKATMVRELEQTKARLVVERAIAKGNVALLEQAVDKARLYGIDELDELIKKALGALIELRTPGTQTPAVG
ncbi:unnamed protein product, partial [Polarella glacialis]